MPRSSRDGLRRLTRTSEPVVQALTPASSPWDDIAGPFLLIEGVQARLGISRGAVTLQAQERQLLRVVTSDAVELYPAWQFHGGAVVEGLSQVLSLFTAADVDGWTVAGWLRTPDPALRRTPISALAGGDLEAVLAAARAAADGLVG